jgi:hypothetical protein
VGKIAGADGQSTLLTNRVWAVEEVEDPDEVGIPVVRTSRVIPPRGSRGFRGRQNLPEFGEIGHLESLWKVPSRSGTRLTGLPTSEQVESLRLGRAEG